jgi:hypothetical protein
MTNGNHPEGGGDAKPVTNEAAEKREQRGKVEQPVKEPTTNPRREDARVSD